MRFSLKTSTGSVPGLKKKINKSEFYDEVVILGALQHVFFKKKKNILKLCKIS